MRLGGAVAALVLALAQPPAVRAEAYDFSGLISLQSRWYPQTAAFPGQRSHASGLVAEPSLHIESEGGVRFSLTSFVRYDSADSRRAHADMREAYLLVHGALGGNFWEFRLGVDQVFWGVAELHNLVDIVNQFDLVEHPREEAKLGQPMAHLTLSGNWGAADLLALPYHRKRTFSGPGGRLRSGRPIVEDALYESAAGERHLDFAARYANTIGPLDFGLSAFAGTNREPFFVPATPENPAADEAPPLIPHYEQIRQFGLDAQLTLGPWLGKLEAIRRNGARNRAGRERNYRAVVLGGEYTFHSVLGSTVDVALLAEWHDDSRGRQATNAWANDVFAALHMAFNDVQSTEIALGLLGDLRHDSRALSVELKRRLSDDWSLRVEAIAYLSVDPRDIHYDTRRDSFLAAHFNYNF